MSTIGLYGSYLWIGDDWHASLPKQRPVYIIVYVLCIQMSLTRYIIGIVVKKAKGVNVS